MKRNAIRFFAAVGVATLATVLALAYGWYYISTPSDGARIPSTRDAWRPDGVTITAIEQQLGGLQTGDVVLAIAGRSVESWLRDVLPGRQPRPAWKLGEIVRYTVLRNGHEVELDVRLVRAPALKILALHWGALVFVLLSLVIGTYVFLRRPSEAAAQLLFVWAWLGCNVAVWSLGTRVLDLVAGRSFWIFLFLTTGAWVLFLSVLLHFALLFPRLSPVLARRPVLAPGLYVAGLAGFAVYAYLTARGAANALDWIGLLVAGQNLVGAVYIALLTALVSWTYARLRDPVAQAQVRWAIFGFVLAAAGGMLLYLLPSVLLGKPLIGETGFDLLAVPVPVALAVAILRYRMFDIDVIINRALVYTVLSALLVLIYFGTVVLLQVIFRGTSPFIIVLSTLATAALFTPLRSRVQAVIDQRFYRRKYDAARTLARFAETVRDEVELDRLADALLSVVDYAMLPDHSTLWLIRNGHAAPPPAKRRSNTGQR